MERLGKELDSVSHWQEVAAQYANALTNPYHRHRLDVINALLPEELFQPGRRVFDFGCGDAILFPQFLAAGAEIVGIDIAPEMIEQGKQRLRGAGLDEGLIGLGDVAKMKELPDGHFDAVISFNVLAYLTTDEERVFYEQASRIVKKGGFLVVTHSNELFDVFTLNRYTAEFFRAHLVAAEHAPGVAGLLARADVPASPTAYNVRENPLAYRHKLLAHGFEETRQEFINLHAAPPPLLAAGKDYPDTLGVPEQDRWKLMFTCSTYGSCSRRA